MNHPADPASVPPHKPRFVLHLDGSAEIDPTTERRGAPTERRGAPRRKD
ncbi:MAG: hypothetical protein ACSLE9_15070 [Burkholderiaceae bacterium]